MVEHVINSLYVFFTKGSPPYVEKGHGAVLEPPPRPHPLKYAYGYGPFFGTGSEHYHKVLRGTCTYFFEPRPYGSLNSSLEGAISKMAFVISSIVLCKSVRSLRCKYSCDLTVIYQLCSV